MREELEKLNKNYLYSDDNMVFNMDLEQMMTIDEAIKLELNKKKTKYLNLIFINKIILIILELLSASIVAFHLILTIYL